MHDGRVVPALSCVGFEPPMAGGPVAVKNHRVLPLEAVLLDAGGAAVDDEAIAAAPLVRVTFERGSGAPVDVTDAALAVGRGTGRAFAFDDSGRWHFNLSTRGFGAPGSYRVTMESGDATSYAISPTCEATFVVE